MFGTIPKPGKAGGEKMAELYAEARRLATEGNFDDIDSGVLIRHYGNLRRINVDFGRKPDDLANLDNLWLHGEPGNGKSRLARDLCKGEAYFNKNLSTWWDGYNGEPIVIIDDLDTTHKWIASHLKHWADLYSFVAQRKGSSENIRPKRIIITSNFTIEEVFANEDTRTIAALQRRFVQQYVEPWQQRHGRGESEILDVESFLLADTVSQ